MARPASAEDNWIAVDWGTTHLRAWAMRGDRAIARRHSNHGMAGLAPDQFEPALICLVDDWLDAQATLVIACGMVGARQGWVEAPYVAVPCAPLAGEALTRAPAKDPRLDVRIAPGLMQREPPDVMRGEETQIAGFLANAPDFEGILCLPGTHTKWVGVEAGRVIRFQTMMTGEIFALLAERSVLRHSIGTGWDQEAFEEALFDPMSTLGRLFDIRAGALLGEASPDAARARLSARLIGSEIAAVLPPGEIGKHQIFVISNQGASTHYVRALELRGARVASMDSENVTLAGLCMARAAVPEGSR